MLVDGAGQIKLTKDGKVLLSEMVSHTVQKERC
jgi:chaperonin GroEL (HSP60 family)